MADAPNWDDLEPIAGPAQPDHSAPKWEDLEPIAGPQQQAAAPKWEDLEPVSKEEPRRPEAPPEDEPSALGTAVRGVLRGAIPTTAGVLGGFAGAAVGGAAGSAVPGPGTVIGGIAGGLAGGFAASEAARGVQEKVADTLGIDSPESRAADAAAHPYINQAAELAPSVASLGTAGKLGARVAVGGIMGGIDLLNQGVNKGFSNIDPAEAAIAAGFGAAAPTPRPWTNKVVGPVEAGAAKFFGRTPQAEGAPVETPATPAEAAPPAGGITEVDNIHMTPDVAAAMAEHPPAAGADVNEAPSVERTLTPEEIAQRQAELIATPARPMVGKSGRPFAPQADNLSLGEERPPINDVLQEPVSPSEPVAAAPDATVTPSTGAEPSPTIPDVDAARAKLQKQTAHLEGKNFYTDPKTGKRWEKVGDQWFEILELQPKTEFENFGGRGVDGQNENISAPEVAPKEPPVPHSLSAGAPEGGAAQTYEIPQEPPKAARLKNTSIWQKLNDTADKLFDLPKWLVAPHTIKNALTGENLGMSADRINRKNMGESFGDLAQHQKAVADATALQDKYFRNMSPAERSSAVTEVENGVIDPAHPGSHAMDAMRKASDAQYEDLAKHGATKEYATNGLSALLPEYQRQAYRDWATQFKADNKRWPTLGDALKYRAEDKSGFKLREDLTNADGSPDVGKVYAQLIHAKAQAALRVKTINDYRNGWGEQKEKGIARLDPLLHDGPGEGLVKVDPTVTDNIPLYAAPEVKAVLERYLNPTLKDVKLRNSYDAYMSIKSATNAINLLGGVYHMRFMLQEGVINEVARGMARMLRGDLGGVKDVVGAPLGPFKLVKTGKNFILDGIQDPKSIKDPLDRYVVDTLKEGGQLPPGRIRGGGITPELETGALRGIVTAWKPAFQEYAHDMVQSGLKVGNKVKAKDYLGAGKDSSILALRALSEGMQVIMHPLFSKYIPLIKAGANFANMKQFMIDNPGLGHDAYVNMARKFVNATDNAMGEMNQSMMYAPAWLKAVGNGTMVSLGWTAGDAKQFLGGAREFIRNPKSAAFGPQHDPRVSYIPAMLAVTALSNIMYQLFKGQGGPQDLTDVVVPRTGGKTKSGTPERAIQPGYEKDVLEMSNIVGGPESSSKAFSHYLYNKLASLPRTAVDEFIFNQDFAGKQIVNPSDPFAKRVQDYMGYAMKHMLVPIVAQQAMHEEKNKDTKIDKFEQFLGNRHAPQQWQEPQKYLSRVQKENAKAAKGAKNFHQNTGY